MVVGILMSQNFQFVKDIIVTVNPKAAAACFLQHKLHDKIC